MFDPRARVSVPLALHGVAIYVFLYLPIALLIFFSFNKSPSGMLPVTGYTLDWYRERTYKPFGNPSQAT